MLEKEEINFADRHVAVIGGGAVGMMAPACSLSIEGLADWSHEKIGSGAFES